MSLPLFETARAHRERTALADPDDPVAYGDLLDRSAAGATRLLAGRDDLEGARVAILVTPGRAWVEAVWAVWRAGGVAVPLAQAHPEPELAYALDDAEPEAVVADPELVDRVGEVARSRRIPLLQTPALLRDGPSGALPEPDPARPALILSTSGTTGRPKGVVLTHGNLEAQTTSLRSAWGWSEEDRILLTLPLHHVHGIVNVLLCALRSGARCDVLPGFDAEAVWERFARGGLTLYMAVPTVYRRLIQAWEVADDPTRARWSRGAATLRLMVSGSAALPVPTLERWEEITGHRLLERYGMTEIGMALSNPLEGERRAGHVGRPLPGVEARLVDQDGRTVPPGEAGTIQVRGPGVFPEYWRRAEATRAAFTADGWFHTGDRAVVQEEAWRILGRESVDILKSGGEKISALEVEDVLRGDAEVEDCAVVGVPDPEWGERVCAAVVLRAGSAPDGEVAPRLRARARSHLAPWKVPKEVRVLEELPRNAMGKVQKPTLVRIFQGEPA